MNVAAYQEKEKNEKTKTGKRKAGEQRKQAIDFKEAACCPSVVVQETARHKNGLCEWSARGHWDRIHCYSGYQVLLINSFYLALLVMITFIQVDTSSYRACKKLQYPSTFRTAIQLFFIRTNNKRKHE